jgi:hypothetical protein
LDVLAYTRSELEKELVLLEKHLRQYPYMGAETCLDCEKKHFSAIEGLAEEGIGFAKSEEESAFFTKVADWAKAYRHHLPNSDEDAIRVARETRSIRKDVLLSPLLEVTHVHDGLPLFMHTSNPGPGPREKPINFRNILQGEASRSMPLNRETAGVLILSGFGAKLLDRGLLELDKYTGRASLSDPFQQIRTWADIGGGAALMAGSYWGIKGKDMVQLGLFNAGEHLLEHSVDVGEQVLTGVSAGLVAAPVTPIPSGGMTTGKGSYAVTY